MTKKISIIVFVLIIAVLILLPKFLTSTEEETTLGPRQRPVMPVNVKILEASEFKNSIRTSGTLISNEEIELRSEVSGKVVKINFQEGGYVKKGTLLVKVNDNELQAQLKKAEIRKKLAEEKEFRQRSLFEKNLLSKEAYDNTLNEFISAKADIENLNALIAKTEIYAPFDGKVGLRYISEGSYATPATKIASLQNNNPIKIDFAIPQKYSNVIKVNRGIQIISASTGKTYSAKIYAVEPKIDPTTKSLMLRAIASNEREELIPGSFVTVDIELDDITNAITIPTEALVNDIKGEMVYLFKNGVAITKVVETSIRNEDEIQVVNGLSIGDTVIVSGIMNMRPRNQVKINKIIK